MPAGWVMGRVASAVHPGDPRFPAEQGWDRHSPLVDGIDVRMEEPQLLRVVLPGGQNQVVAGQTQGPLDGRIKGPVQHHIVHPWGLDQFRKFHAPQRREDGHRRVRERLAGYTAAGLPRRTTWSGAGRRGGDRARDTGPHPGLGRARRGLWPPNTGLGRADSPLPHPLVAPGPGLGRRGLPETGSAAAAATWTPASRGEAKGEGGGRFRDSSQVPAARHSWRK